MSDTLFTEPTSSAAAPADQAAPAPMPSINIPAEAAGLIGEGKKYATVEAALAALPHAQNHISVLEQENHEFKEKLMANDKLDQVLERLSTPAPAAPVETTTAQPTVTREELGELVQQEIARVSTVNREAANRATVESKLREVYGDNVATVFNQKAEEVGMSPAQLTALAKVAPQAVLTLVGENNKGDRLPSHTSEGLNLKTIGNIGSGEPAKKDIMFGASTEEVISEWRACAPKLED